MWYDTKAMRNKNPSPERKIDRILKTMDWFNYKYAVVPWCCSRISVIQTAYYIMTSSSSSKRSLLIFNYFEDVWNEDLLSPFFLYFFFSQFSARTKIQYCSNRSTPVHQCHTRKRIFAIIKCEHFQFGRIIGASTCSPIIIKDLLWIPFLQWGNKSKEYI